jgi:putative transcriptional regulator
VPRKKEPRLTNCIRELRAAQPGMTQQDLADRVGVTRQTIVALEGGAYTPSLALALRIARAFKKTTEQVFCLDE